MVYRNFVAAARNYRTGKKKRYKKCVKKGEERRKIEKKEHKKNFYTIIPEDEEDTGVESRSVAVERFSSDKWTIRDVMKGEDFQKFYVTKLENINEARVLCAGGATDTIDLSPQKKKKLEKFGLIMRRWLKMKK